MASLALCLLGGFQARLSTGRLLAISGKKTQALLACLALSPGNSLTREKLAGMLWSDHDDAHARNSLRQTLSALRRDLSAVDPFPLAAGHDALMLDRGAVDVDVAAFEELARATDPGELQEAAALYRGDLLDGIHVTDPAFEDWFGAERERLRKLAIHVLERLVPCQDGPDGIATAHRLLALDPLREASHRVVMEAYASQGETDLALRHYESCRGVLRRELGVVPDEATEALCREIRQKRFAPIRLGPFVPHAEEQALPDQPQKPAVAVLPFVDMNGEPERYDLGAAATEGVITELSRFHSLSVIAHNASFECRGNAIDVKRLGRELSIQFAVAGSVRRVGPRIRISARLIDTATGSYLWAEHYDQDIQSSGSVDDTIVTAIAARMAQQIEIAGIEKARRKRPEQMTARDWLMRGLESCSRSTIGDVEAMRLLFQNAISADPNLAQAYSYVACTLINGYWMDYYKTERSAPGLDCALDFATRAVELDGRDSVCHRYLAFVHLCRKSFERAKRHLDIAISLNPNDADLATSRGLFELFTGRPDAGFELFEHAERLIPCPSDGDWELRGMALYGLGRYEDALAVFDRMTATPVWIDRFRAACFAQLHHHAEARAWTKEALRREPRFTLRRYATVEPYESQTDLRHFIDGMRKAGLPE